MRRFYYFVVSMMVAGTLTAGAQNYRESSPEIKPNTSLRPSKTVLLYPEGQAAGKGISENGVEVTHGPAQDNGLTGSEIIKPSGNRSNIGDDARMDIYLPKKPNGQMVIICPGGGYGFVSSFNEGVYVAEWMVEHGITACVLKYRMPNCHDQVPITDTQNAFRYCRYHAAEWGVRQIGIIGFSAGGHLAGWASTMYVDKTTRPDFSVLVYPRVKLTAHEDNGTKLNLLGPEPKLEPGQRLPAPMLAREVNLEHFSLASSVGPDVPSTLIALSADDNSVPADNSCDYYSALLANKVPVELHVFPAGGHGWGFSAEKYVGKGNDKFSKYRPEFEAVLLRWLGERLAEAG